MVEADLENDLFEEMSTKSDSSKDEIIPSENSEPEIPLLRRRLRRPKPPYIT